MKIVGFLQNVKFDSPNRPKSYAYIIFCGFGNILIHFRCISSDYSILHSYPQFAVRHKWKNRIHIHRSMLVFQELRPGYKKCCSVFSCKYVCCGLRRKPAFRVHKLKFHNTSEWHKCCVTVITYSRLLRIPYP